MSSTSSSRTSTSAGSHVAPRRWHHRRGGPPTDHVALTPPNLLKQHVLPIAAYFHTPEAPPGVDISQPLLLYRNYTSTKVRAASLQISRESGLLAVGPTLVIPDSYTGWFSVVTHKGRSASHFASIEELSTALPSFFLTRFDIPAYLKEVEECNRVTYRRTTVQSGHVLKLLGIFEDLNRRKLSGEHGRGGGGGGGGGGKNKYIQCLNHSNEIIFVPFYVTGRFYETAERGSTNVNHVFLMSQILSTFQLPLTVRLVCGFMPRVPQAFTGVLRLEKIEKEAVILACTITSEARATLLEMDLASNFLLRPILDPLYMKTPIFLKSVSYCSEEADSWQRQIKVIHHVTEDDSESSLRRSSNSNTTTMSSSSVGLNLSIFTEFDKIKGRGRERSKTRGEKGKNFSKLRDKSRDIKRSIEKNKENRDNDDSRSRDSRLKIKVKEKMQEKSRNPQYVVNGEFISIRVDDKLSGKKGYDNRKVSKQNTYIFQNERIVKHHDKRRNLSETEDLAPQSIESQEYATVLDDISHVREEVRPETSSDAQYAEICELKIRPDTKNGVIIKVEGKRS